MKKRATLLAAVRRKFSAALGSQLKALYLYGSHARGEAQPGSDIDILVVIDGDFDYAHLLNLTSPIVASLSLENDVVISRAFVSSEDFEAGQSPFLRNVRREGVAF